MQKIPENSKILKKDGHFRIPHPQISLKQCSEKLTHPTAYTLVDQHFRFFNNRYPTCCLGTKHIITDFQWNQLNNYFFKMVKIEKSSFFILWSEIV